MNKKILGMLAVGAVIATVSVGGIFVNSSVRADNTDFVKEGGMLYGDDYSISAEEAEGRISSLKAEFYKEFGNEDIFKIMYEDDETLAEVNGAKGIFRYTNKSTNEVEEQKYFEELDEEVELAKLTPDIRKQEFIKEYGNEDIFKKVYEDDEYIEEVNGEKGIVKYTDKSTNEVEEYDYFGGILE